MKELQSPDAAVRELARGHEQICRTLRETADADDEVKDKATADILTDRLKAHEHMAWMLRSLVA